MPLYIFGREERQNPVVDSGTGHLSKYQQMEAKIGKFYLKYVMNQTLGFNLKIIV